MEPRPDTRAAPLLRTIAPEERQSVRSALMGGVAPASGTPTLYAMAGVPGAGKTTFVARAQETGLFPRPAFILNPDLVMEALPGYRADLGLMGPRAAFAAWEMPARMLAYELGCEAAARRLPIIKDMGMVRAENWDMLRDFRDLGYRIELHVIECAHDLALASCAARERHFPADQIAGRAAALRALLAQYAAVPERVFWYERTAKTITPKDPPCR